MQVDLEKTVKILSRGLTALVSLRSLFRSGVSIKKLMGSSKLANETVPNPAKKDDEKKRKQLHGALIGMGYKRPEVDRVVQQLSDKIESELITDLVRDALDILNK